MAIEPFLDKNVVVSISNIDGAQMRYIEKKVKLIAVDAYGCHVRERTGQVGRDAVIDYFIPWAILYKIRM